MLRPHASEGRFRGLRVSVVPAVATARASAAAAAIKTAAARAAAIKTAAAAAAAATAAAIAAAVIASDTATERWLLAAFAQTSALRVEAAMLLLHAPGSDIAVEGLHAVLESLVLRSTHPPPRVRALRMRLGMVDGAACAPEPAPERRKRGVRRAHGYSHEIAVWMPGMQRRVNAYNEAVFALRGFDASLARRYVEEPADINVSKFITRDHMQI